MAGLQSGEEVESRLMAGGGVEAAPPQVKIESRRLEWSAAPRTSTVRQGYSPGGGDKKVGRIPAAPSTLVATDRAEEAELEGRVQGGLPGEGPPPGGGRRGQDRDQEAGLAGRVQGGIHQEPTAPSSGR